MVDQRADTVLTGDVHAAGATVPRRRWGILVTMTIAFAVVAGMAVTSEMVAWVSLRHIETQLTVVVQHSVPAMATAETLVVEAAAIAHASGTLTAASTEDQRTTAMTKLAGRIAGLNRQLDELQRLEIDSRILGDLRDRVASLAVNLNRQSDLVAQRIALNTLLYNDATQLADGHKQFLAAVL